MNYEIKKHPGKAKMNALGKYCHDFPRLAEESGYNFHLHRGKINWSDLDTLNIQEIIEERNFRLLEENLIHVVNCNLEREYDVKILDQNFVKLFKLAQLGIDYLSYCELYLDKCVILLQEQLFSSQEECSILKEEIERKNEELIREKNKRKLKVQRQNVKCNKCQKFFLNEIYLESHEKRRHKNISEIDNKNDFSAYTDQIQQTEEIRKSASVSTQTTEEKYSMPRNDITLNEREITKISEQEQKIEYLKRDLEELKLRLSLAEKTMEEKKNDMKSFQNGCNFPNSIMPIIHSCILPNNKEYLRVNSNVSTSVHNQSNQFMVPQDFSNENHRENRISNLISILNTPTKLMHDDVEIKQFTPDKTATAEIISSTKTTEKVQNNENYTINLTDDSQNMCNGEKSETRQLNDKFIEEKKIQPSENSKIFLDIQYDAENFQDNSNDTSLVLSSNDLRAELETFNANIYPSTNIKLSKAKIAKKNSLNEVETSRYFISTDSPVLELEDTAKKRSDENFPAIVEFADREEKSKSLLRKITIKNPKIQEMTFNLKNSFSQLYDSVSSIGKKNSYLHETNVKLQSKSDIIEGLNSRLRDLGIDPEWTGIPKETMKEKLNVLEHNRNLLSKENQLYPFFRRKLKKHVLKKLRNNSISSKKKTQTGDKSSELIASERIDNNKLPEKDIYESSKIKVCDSERDSADEILNLIEDKFKINNPDNKNLSKNIESVNVGTGKPYTINTHDGNERVEMETDFSIFQAGKFKEKVKEMKSDSSTKKRIIADELQTESDFDEEFFKEFQEQSFESIRHHMIDKVESPKKSIIGSFPVKSDFADDSELSSFQRFQNQSILKNEGKYKSEFLCKKKVIFAEPEIFDTAIKPAASNLKTLKVSKMYNSSEVDDDDSWSLEND